MEKVRSAVSIGLQNRESSWLYQVVAADFGGVSVAAAATISTGGILIPLVNPLATLKYPDAYQSDQPGGKLLVASGARPIGTGLNPFATLAGVFVAHVTAAGAVYQPAAGTTVQVKVISAAAAVAGSVSNLTGAFALATAANFIDQIPITAPAERQVSNEGAALLTTYANLFNGDYLWVDLVSTGALNVQGNKLTVFLEFV